MNFFLGIKESLSFFNLIKSNLEADIETNL